MTGEGPGGESVAVCELCLRMCGWARTLPSPLPRVRPE